jgi:hypothetical protein
VVIGFATTMMKFDDGVTKGHGGKPVDSFCGFKCVVRNEITQAWTTPCRPQVIHDGIDVTSDAPELTRIDANIPIVRISVAIKSPLYIFVSDDAWSLMSKRCSICAECDTATNVINVAVSVNQCIEWVRGPRPNGVNDLLASIDMACIKAHKSIARVPRDDVTERFNYGETIGNFGEFTSSSVDRFVCYSRIHNFGTKTNEVCHVVLLI